LFDEKSDFNLEMGVLEALGRWGAFTHLPAHLQPKNFNFICQRQFADLLNFFKNSLANFTIHQTTIQ